jgi:NADH:ubiquinone oxidoreductase subunit F (NADH-binding)
VLRRDGRYFTQLPVGLEEIPESTPAYVEAHLQHLSAYREQGGYSTLVRYLSAPDPEGLIRRLEAAGIRGMGGAGFPAHIKWKAVRSSPRSDRILLVNAHEGEPATFKDRELLETEPHRLLEGALLAALVVRAQRIVVGLRSEYVQARRSLEVAVAELNGFARAWGHRGVLPPIEVRPVPGPYVTGEETALMEALEGRRGEPRLRPPYPAEVGLEGRPTLVQNVETLAALPGLLAEPASPRPPEKVYCLTGDVARPGAFRRPLGVPATELVRDAGETDPSTLKAFLPGGLSGGLLPASRLTVPLEFAAVQREGAGLGTGAVIAIGTDRCLVDILETIAGFFEAESCGKCVPCRLGTAKLHVLLNDLRAGRATEADLEAGVTLAQTLQETSICALGQVAGKAFVDAMRHFPQELLAHTRGECPARPALPEAAV